MLIWASIAEHAAQTLGPADTLFFVTGNHNDFCEDKALTTVATVLLADLTGADQGTKCLPSFRRTVAGQIPTIRRVADLSNVEGSAGQRQ